MEEIERVCVWLRYRQAFNACFKKGCGSEQREEGGTLCQMVSKVLYKKMQTEN